MDDKVTIGKKTRRLELLLVGVGLLNLSLLLSLQFQSNLHKQDAQATLLGENPDSELLLAQAQTVPVNYQFPATDRSDATAQARSSVGKADPMTPIILGNEVPVNAATRAAYQPAAKRSAPSRQRREHEWSGFIKPPPVTDPSLAAAAVGGYGYGGPAVPTPPNTVADKLKVAGIIGDKTILQVPAMVRLQRKWPATLTLGPGESFESISVVSVDNDKVTLEEDGKRSVKSLPTCR